MDYVIPGTNKKFGFNYVQLREEYEQICNYTDKEFLDNLPQALHLSCAIGFIKGLGTTETISDVGIVHQLIHILDGSGNGFTTLAEVRKDFKELLRLSP